MEVTKANLATYLAGLTPSATPYPIEITETVASDWGLSGTSGTVGNIINTNTPNGVYLDLGLTVIPNSVTNMPYTFDGCTSLTTAPAIPNSVTNMPYTFRSCTSLTTAPIIPNSVTDMPHAFDGCTSLTTAPAIPNSVTDMTYTFRSCTSLTTAPIIPNSVTNMPYTFRSCTSLTTAPIIPNSVTNMPYTFRSCTSLTTAPIIPNSVTNMYRTFNGCTVLHTIQNFAVNVDTCIMTEAFGECPALANIYVTTLTESSWHLLHTDTDATGTDYTIYNPDGTVAGSGTAAGTSQVLTLYGKSDELVISANITPTLAVETATSQVQWHKSGLPYDDELLIFNAKNPDTVISNFITVNRAGEEFLGRAKDSYPIPTDAVLQYSFDEIKQLPDNPTGTVYKRDNDWTTVDGWLSGHASITLSTENQSLKVVYDGTTGLSIQKTGLTYNGKFIVGRLKSTVPILAISYYNGTVVVNLKLTAQNAYETVFYGKMQSTSPTLLLYINVGQLVAKTCWIESMYIGDGSYLDPVIDNSYSESHAENHGVIPVDGVCGKAGYFNNSYMIAPSPALGDDITIYFWAKFDESTSGSIICSSRVFNDTNGMVCYFSGSFQKYALTYGGISTTFNQSLVSGWHHVTMKCNDTTKVLKINGVPVDTVTGTFTTHTNYDTTILFGKDNFVTFTRPFYMDGFKIVPRFTTDDEDTGEYKARANHPKFYATADKWKTARNITISDADGTNTGTAVSVDGSENETLKLPATIKANLSGNAGTATKLATARKIHGDEFDGTADIYDTYSTTEKRIGTWIDGKPIYRRVVPSGISAPSGEYTFTLNQGNIETIFKVFGIRTPGTFLPFETLVLSTTTTTSVFRIYNQDGWGNIQHFILEYTKTTD